jgi:hypothetical protein
MELRVRRRKPLVLVAVAALIALPSPPYDGS